MNLSIDDFSAVFQALHCHPPFAWQTRLLHEVVAQGWPDTIAAPTGTGKTAVLDIALFHLALEAGTDGPRMAARRIVLAVDRRVVVDQAFERAKKIRCALAKAKSGVLGAFADALRAAGAGRGDPLHVEELRGGMPREDDWVREPAQPTILCTTVDQLGSRLLFRGYGVSPGMAPVHAGLLGEDALLLLDEAHLSGAFRETLAAVGRRRNSTVLGLPWSASMMTATPGAMASRPFDLTEEERTEPAIAVRLTAGKRAELRTCDSGARTDNHVAALAAAASDMAAKCERASATIAIVVNRVALARAVFDALRNGERDAILLTGRVRPVERDALIDAYRARLFAGRTLPPGTPTSPLFVVATQCIEAGADFDFDAMVTQVAPLDALQQRFGRLNRMGSRKSGPAVILAAKDEISSKADDPVYGNRSKLTWDWLTRHAAVATKKDAPSLNVCPDALRFLIANDTVAAAACIASADSAPAPVLRGADIAFFSTTSPIPHPDPYLPLFLHGEAKSETDVSIVWRADCFAPESSTDTDTETGTRDIVGCLRPRPAEALRVPIWAAKAWLAGIGGSPSGKALDIMDVEGEAAPVQSPAGGTVRVFRWRGPDDDETKWIAAADVRPGDLIVVPSTYGGCDRFGWAPASGDDVLDIAEQAAEPYSGRTFALRLHPALWKQQVSIHEPNPGAGDGEQQRTVAPPAWSELWPELLEAADRGAAQLLAKLSETVLPGAIAKWRCLLKPEARLEVRFPYPTGSGEDRLGVVLAAPAGVKSVQEAGGGTTEDESGGSFSGQPIGLDRHVKAVAAQAERMAKAIGLPDVIVNAVRFAALHHDDGKADPRFQAWLGGSDARSDLLLAKSERWRGSVQEAAARLTAGLPRHWRHEVLSVRAAVHHLASCADDMDHDLAVYLIGAHHGQGRPFFVHDDPWDERDRPLRDITIAAGPGPHRLDFDWHGRDWPGLFADLRARYGTWGLAFLEAVMRLADHRASEKPGALENPE